MSNFEKDTSSSKPASAGLLKDPLMWVMVSLVAICIFTSISVVVQYQHRFEGVAFPKSVTERLSLIDVQDKQNREELSKAVLDTRAEFGQLGDFFGGTLNPLFGFVSVIALLITIVYQARELKLSRAELELSRIEATKSATALSFQNVALEQQRFEQTFFSWLGTYRELLGEISTTDYQNTPLVGRNALYQWWRYSYNLSNLVFSTINENGDNDEVMAWIRIAKGFPKKLTVEDIECMPQALRGKFSENLHIAWEDFYTSSEVEFQLDSLFRLLFNLLRWIDSQDEARVNAAQKWLYISIVRAQLSWIEMAVLYINGLTKRGDKFGLLAEKYALFDNLNFETDITLLALRHSVGGYAEKAYDSRLARSCLQLPATAEDTLIMAGTLKTSEEVRRPLS